MRSYKCQTEGNSHFPGPICLAKAAQEVVDLLCSKGMLSLLPTPSFYANLFRRLAALRLSCFHPRRKSFSYWTSWGSCWLASPACPGSSEWWPCLWLNWPLPPVWGHPQNLLRTHSVPSSRLLMKTWRNNTGTCTDPLATPIVTEWELAFAPLTTTPQNWAAPAEVKAFMSGKFYCPELQATPATPATSGGAESEELSNPPLKSHATLPAHVFIFYEAGRDKFLAGINQNISLGWCWRCNPGSTPPRRRFIPVNVITLDWAG